MEFLITCMSYTGMHLTAMFSMSSFVAESKQLSVKESSPI